MAHDHHRPHSHATAANVTRKLAIATAITLALVIGELVAGVWAGSLALIGDAFHNVADTIALAIALVARRLGRRPATDEKSFGYQRAGFLAAFVNAGTLVFLAGYLVVEAFDRLQKPNPVGTIEMLAVAGAGLAVNVAITLSLRREGRDDVSIRSAVMHMIGDAISSVGIIVAAVMIRLTGSPRWDAGVSFLIALLILWSSWGILRESVNLLLDGTPEGIDPGEVTRALASVEGIEGVHHLHIWALGPARPALSCHLMVGDVPLRSTSSLLARVTEMLHERYRIVHATVQFEFAHCGADDPYCLPYPASAEKRDGSS